MDSGSVLKNDINKIAFPTEKQLGTKYTRKLFMKPMLRKMINMGIIPPEKYIVKNASIR